MEFGIIVGLVVFVLGLAGGLPLCWVFLASSALALILLGSPLSFMAGAAYHSMDSYILMAVAFFIFAGNLMAKAGLADRLIRLAYVLVGRIKGGLVDVGIVTNLFLGALTGSSLPCLAALVPLLVPHLERFGIERRYTTAVLCSTCYLGYLIPPSVPVLIYCLMAHQSVAAVFLSTVFPGILLAIGYMVVNYFLGPKYMHPSKEIPELPTGFKRTTKEAGRATWAALPALGCPLIVLGGIYGGVITPNEAGCVAVVYTLIIGAFVYRELKAKTIWRVSRETLGALGMIALLLAFAVVFTRLMIREGVAQALTEATLGAFQSKYLILLMLNILMLILGMFIDELALLLIVVPLIMPLVGFIGVNLVQLGAIVVLNIGIALTTPPYGFALFMGARLSGVPYDQLIRPILPFILLAALPVLFLTTYVPALTCWLPTVVVGQQAVGAW